MTTHTPGPWTTGGIFDPNGPDPTTNVWGRRPRGAQSGHVVAHGVRLADAHLIAAAPDLLEALRLLMECGRKDLSNPKYDGYYESARAAITKAEGRS